jgi:hypothetical protein
MGDFKRYDGDTVAVIWLCNRGRISRTDTNDTVRYDRAKRQVIIMISEIHKTIRPDTPTLTVESFTTTVGPYRIAQFTRGMKTIRLEEQS